MQTSSCATIYLIASRWMLCRPPAPFLLTHALFNWCCISHFTASHKFSNWFNLSDEVCEHDRISFAAYFACRVSSARFPLIRCGIANSPKIAIETFDFDGNLPMRTQVKCGEMQREVKWAFELHAWMDSETCLLMLSVFQLNNLSDNRHCARPKLIQCVSTNGPGQIWCVCRRKGVTIFIAARPTSTKCCVSHLSLRRRFPECCDH